MSAPEVLTGDVVTVLSATEARTLTEKIAEALGTVWADVRAAYLGRAWTALDYESWDAYCDAEFGATRIQLPREERQDVVKSLHDWGLSVRAIASATGASVGTVHSDLKSGVQNRTPEDGPTEPDLGPGYEPASDEPEEAPKTTGVDGKEYSRTRTSSSRTEEHGTPPPKAEQPKRSVADQRAVDRAHGLAGQLSQCLPRLIDERTIRLLRAVIERWENQ